MRDIERRAREAHAKTNSFLRHLDWARREVESAFSHGKAMVSTSWGKDSVALCSIAFGVDASVPMVHLRSPYELPGGEHVIAHFRELGSNLITLDTRKDLAGYIEWLTQYGLGYERESHAKAGRAK
jgi:hypothetical protein